MISENDVLLILHNDDWFTPSKSEKKKTVTNKDGNVLEVAESYYHNLEGGGQIIIRVSNHGTSLRTWLKRRKNPSESLQNLSVVFSNEPVTCELITEPIKKENERGEVVLQNLYFVVEQYVYRMENLSIKDFTKFIKRIKSLDDNTVFTDPFKKKPKKRALRAVFTPQTEDGKKIPPSNNDVHTRQTIVATNPNNEVDADGNVIKDSKLFFINKIITETINNYINRCCKLNEAYLGDLYHLTTLSHLYNILKHNCIYRFEDEYCHKDRRMGTDTNVVCLTRSKEFKYKTINSVRITLDGELMSSSLRNAKIHPFRYYEDGEENCYGVNNTSEFEERVYNSNIYPLKKYCKSIDIYVGDINKCDYYFCDDVDYAYEGLYSSGVTNPTDKQINEWFLTHIIEDFPQWLNIIHIHGINTINEVLTKKYYSRNY